MQPHAQRVELRVDDHEPQRLYEGNRCDHSVKLVVCVGLEAVEGQPVLRHEHCEVAGQVELELLCGPLRQRAHCALPRQRHRLHLRVVVHLERKHAFPQLLAQLAALLLHLQQHAHRHLALRHCREVIRTDAAVH